MTAEFDAVNCRDKASFSAGSRLIHSVVKGTGSTNKVAYGPPVRVGAVGVGVHCNALAREARFRKICSIPLISDQLALVMDLSDFDRDLIEQTGVF